VIGAVIVGGAVDWLLMHLPTETRVTLRERPQLDRVWTDTDLRKSLSSHAGSATVANA
jgi:hypothetical protein